MSALTHEADIRWCQSHVGFVPQADIAAFGIAQLEIRSIGSYETLIQAVLNSSERGLYFGADTPDGHNNHDRNTTGNKAVFDGRRAVFIPHEPNDKITHAWLLGPPGENPKVKFLHFNQGNC